MGDVEMASLTRSVRLQIAHAHCISERHLVFIAASTSMSSYAPDSLVTNKTWITTLPGAGLALGSHSVTTVASLRQL